MSSPFQNEDIRCQNREACVRSSLASAVCQPCYFRWRRQRATESGPKWCDRESKATYTEIGRGRFRGTVDGMDVGDYEPVVIYRADKDGSLCVRTVDQFNDGRFERISEGDSHG